MTVVGLPQRAGQGRAPASVAATAEAGWERGADLHLPQARVPRRQTQEREPGLPWQRPSTLPSAGLRRQARPCGRPGRAEAARPSMDAPDPWLATSRRHSWTAVAQHPGRCTMVPASGIHHSAADKAAGVRGFFGPLLEVTKCHQDVQGSFNHGQSLQSDSGKLKQLLTAAQAFFSSVWFKASSSQKI